MNILVIGGSGLFGRKTLLSLLRDKEVNHVVSMDVTPPQEYYLNSLAKYGDRFQFVHGDVSRLEDILCVMRAHAIDRMVNFAFLIGTAVEENPRLAVKINVLGMSNAFEAARLMGVKRVVYPSSETVYGTQDDYGDREVVEEDVLYPKHAYALAKRLAELMAEQYTALYGMSFTGMRPTIGLGHGGRTPFIVKWLSDLVSLPAVGKPFSTEMDGKGMFSPVYADDVGEFTKVLLKAESSKSPVYNIGRSAFCMRDIAAHVRNFIPEAEIHFGTQAMSGKGKGGLPWKISMNKVKEEFGFEPIPLGEMVLRHINEARTEAGLPLIER
jgi:UDP-glucose 4-epimerase